MAEAADHEVIPAFRPLLPTADQLLPYLHRIDQRRIYSNHGPLVEELQNRLLAALKLRSGYLLTAASGTAALVGGILATAGRATAQRPYALCPAYTFVGTVSALEQCGYRPHLVDVDALTWQLDAASLLEHPLLPQTGVVIPVAPLGRAVPVDAWQAFRRQSGVAVVVDGAASLEALLRDSDRYAGDIPVALSFHATKVFPTGEGGALLSTDTGTMERAFKALNFGFLGSRQSVAPSINGKMSEYHAAIGLACLDQWPQRIAAFIAVATEYRLGFDRAGLGGRLYSSPDIASNYAVFDCADHAQSTTTAATLLAAGIESRLWYGHGLQHQPAFRDLSCDALPVVEDLAPRLLGLPMAPDLDARSVARIVSVIRQLHSV